MDDRIVCGRYSIILGNGKFSKFIKNNINDNINKNNNVLVKITYFNEKKIMKEKIIIL